VEHPRRILERFQIRPKKSLGQNFLHDANVLRRIATAAEVEAGDEVLEIGPGLGALTEVLAEVAARVVAVELDDRLMPVLRERLAGRPQVELIQGDILERDPAVFFHGPYKAVGNVPYYITGAILRHLLAAAHKPVLFVLTVQREVAERMTAAPDQMSLLAVTVQYFGRPAIEFTISAGAFWPRPDVDSAVVKIRLHGTPLLDAAAEATYFRLVRAGFGQRRKQLQKNLRSLGRPAEAIAAALARCGIDGRRRAETLALEEWLALARALT
jgi:16S rRNA (adenine1518-N6/adenine1519-N6)-dimethyltransferase